MVKHPTRLLPFYLRGERGPIFAVLHAPADDDKPKGALLFVPPFAEEMNKSRRMTATQARNLAAGGWFVLIFDLYGCGDSGGELAEVTWETWSSDLRTCRNWLAKETGYPVNLWALRFGALLALDNVSELDDQPPRILLWQPIIDGKAILRTLLRQRLVAEMASGRKQTETTASLRARLSAGETLEISGYCISASLAASLDRTSLYEMRRLSSRIDWIDIAQETEPSAVDQGAGVRANWTGSGIAVSHYRVTGDPFWTAGEILECPDLVRKTSSLLS